MKSTNIILLAGLSILLILSILILVKVDKNDSGSKVKVKDYVSESCAYLGVDDGAFPCGQWAKQSASGQQCTYTDEGGNMTTLNCRDAQACCNGLSNCKNPDGTYQDTCYSD